MKFFKNRLAVTIVVLSVTFLILIGVSVKRQNASFLESGVGTAFTSVQGVIYKASNGVKDWFSFVIHFSEIKQENTSLKSENISMKKKVSSYDSLQKKYDKLAALESLEDQKNEYDYVNCNVIGRGSGDAEDSFAIDKGKNDGIRIGLAVITEDGLVGRVISVYGSYSIIGSLNNVNIQVAAMDQSTRDNSGIVKGYLDSNNNKLAILDGLEQNADVKKGDEIITYGTLYPKDIPIGQVISVGEDTSTVSKNAVIKPYVDFNKLEVVSVVKPKNNDVSEIKY
ncbi:MAG: rod shape-determining protein MreC [Clostridium sp.]|nr:rod shape-determining protein MreC [Clostridium sp.]